MSAAGTAIRRCDIEGDYKYVSDKPQYREHCMNPPTWWYIAKGMVPGHRSYRCDEHVKWLTDDPEIVLECGRVDDELEPPDVRFPYPPKQ